MNQTHLKKLIKKYVEPEFSGYKLFGRMYLKVPYDYVISGYYFEAKSDASFLFLSTFTQPLYVPRDCSNKTLSQDIATIRLDIDSESVIAQNVIYKMKEYELSVQKLASPRVLTQFPEPEDYENKFALERRAYSLVLCSDFQQGRKQLLSVIRLARNILRKTDHAQVFSDMIGRAEELIRLIDINPKLAIDKLDEYTAYTKSHLRLT